MSHGCDSSDFEGLLGPVPVTRGGEGVTRPIFFLLERPGGDWDNGGPVKFHRFNKWPPVKHYYWTPDCSAWPQNSSDVTGNYYGNYFAYLMRKHALRNVYITNLVKCRQQERKKESRIETECFNRYLRRELTLFKPDIAFCFGWRAKNGLRVATQRDVNFKARIVFLYHPIFIQVFSRAHGRTSQEVMKQNDEWIKDALLRPA
jgi:hypothetical protein